MNTREPKEKKRGGQKIAKSNLRANITGLGEGVKEFLVFRRRFFGSWFGEFGCAGIFVIVSFPLVPIRRSGRRRRDRVGRVRTSDSVSLLEEPADL